ncbi:unnamed protein product [Amoebophrya sp. A120]|nr:unnamed protein product [Amoebophrya sp. A120]|eukprot:GSA120T00001252001.1
MRTKTKLKPVLREPLSMELCESDHDRRHYNFYECGVEEQIRGTNFRTAPAMPISFHPAAVPSLSSTSSSSERISGTPSSSRRTQEERILPRRGNIKIEISSRPTSTSMRRTVATRRKSRRGSLLAKTVVKLLSATTATTSSSPFYFFAHAAMATAPMVLNELDRALHEKVSAAACYSLPHLKTPRVNGNVIGLAISGQNLVALTEDNVLHYRPLVSTTSTSSSFLTSTSSSTKNRGVLVDQMLQKTDVDATFSFMTKADLGKGHAAGVEDAVVDSPLVLTGLSADPEAQRIVKDAQRTRKSVTTPLGIRLVESGRSVTSSAGGATSSDAASANAVAEGQAVSAANPDAANKASSSADAASSSKVSSATPEEVSGGEVVQTGLHVYDREVPESPYLYLTMLEDEGEKIMKSRSVSTASTISTTSRRLLRYNTQDHTAEELEASANPYAAKMTEERDAASADEKITAGVNNPGSGTSTSSSSSFALSSEGQHVFTVAADGVHRDGKKFLSMVPAPRAVASLDGYLFAVDKENSLHIYKTDSTSDEVESLVSEAEKDLRRPSIGATVPGGAGISAKKYKAAGAVATAAKPTATSSSSGGTTPSKPEVILAEQKFTAETAGEAAAAASGGGAIAKKEEQARLSVTSTALGLFALGSTSQSQKSPPVMISDVPGETSNPNVVAIQPHHYLDAGLSPVSTTTSSKAGTTANDPAAAEVGGTTLAGVDKMNQDHDQVALLRGSKISAKKMKGCFKTWGEVFIYLITFTLVDHSTDCEPGTPVAEALEHGVVPEIKFLRTNLTQPTTTPAPPASEVKALMHDALVRWKPKKEDEEEATTAAPREGESTAGVGESPAGGTNSFLFFLQVVDTTTKAESGKKVVVEQDQNQLDKQISSSSPSISASSAGDSGKPSEVKSDPDKRPLMLKSKTTNPAVLEVPAAPPVPAPSSLSLAAASPTAKKTAASTAVSSARDETQSGGVAEADAQHPAKSELAVELDLAKDRKEPMELAGAPGGAGALSHDAAPSTAAEAAVKVKNTATAEQAEAGGATAATTARSAIMNEDKGSLNASTTSSSSFSSAGEQASRLAAHLDELAAGLQDAQQQAGDLLRQSKNYQSLDDWRLQHRVLLGQRHGGINMGVLSGEQEKAGTSSSEVEEAPAPVPSAARVGGEVLALGTTSQTQATAASVAASTTTTEQESKVMKKEHEQEPRLTTSRSETAPAVRPEVVPTSAAATTRTETSNPEKLESTSRAGENNISSPAQLEQFQQLQQPQQLAEYKLPKLHEVDPDVMKNPEDLPENDNRIALTAARSGAKDFTVFLGSGQDVFRFDVSLGDSGLPCPV